MRASEAGFSLIEVLLAAALFVVVALGAFEVVRQLLQDAQHLSVRHHAYATLEQLTAQLRAEARTATAIWTSSPSAGAGSDDCVQVDFYTADAGGAKFWSYRSFPNHGAADPVAGDILERLAGTAPIAPCDASQRGEVVLTNLQSPPAVAQIAASVLRTHQDVYSSDGDSGFIAATVPATPALPLGVLDASGAPVRGGNAVVELRVDTGDGSRVVDLLPGVFPNGFTEVLRYTCSERCDVGHDTNAPKTLTACALSWQAGWSTFVRWSDYTTNPDGSLSFPAGWFIAGAFVFTYSGTRASDGGTDSLAKSYPATNWDAARDYAAFPPDRPAADGASAGSSRRGTFAASRRRRGSRISRRTSPPANAPRSPRSNNAATRCSSKERAVDSTRTAERGFTLLELLLCVGILAAASAATAGAFAAVARNAGPGATRDVALMVAENALVRARAAIAYASSPALDGPALLGDRSWGLVPGATQYVAGAQLRANAMCGTNAPLLLRLPVATAYDPASERFTVVVTYPRDPCGLSGHGTVATGEARTVSLTETLPPSAYPPGQTVHHDVPTPARM